MSNENKESLHVPSVLFVCYANICRSPTAEAVFRRKALEAGLKVTIDSAGTHCQHPGKRPDKRSQEAGMRRGYPFNGIQSRKVQPQDFDNFDYILPMDSSNLTALNEICPEHLQHKIQRFLTFAPQTIQSKALDVPDPYYGGRRGFEIVLDLIQYAAEGLLAHLKETSD